MLLVERHPKRSLLLLLPAVLTGAFVWQLLIVHFADHRTALTVLDLKILSRYFIGLPGSLLAAWGLLQQVPALRANRCPRIGHLYGAVVCFVLYAFMAGLVVPKSGYLLSGLLNETSFAAVVGMPVEVARGLVILGLTYCVGGLLDIFHLETERRLRTAEQDRALLREREQIGRDLHDGVMQTLYGTGLGLKQLATLSQTNPDQAQAILTELNQEIGRAVVQMRRYVQDLKEHTFSGAELTEAVRLQVSEMGQFAGLPVTFETDLVDDPDRRIPAGLREEVLSIAREGLSNIVRHSRASGASVLLGLEDDTIILRVSDDGEGFDTSTATAGRGLESLRERVDSMGGLLQIHSTPGEGTRLVAHLPLVRRGARQRTGVTNV
ncbi:MAG: hypothetical protein K0R39_1402 [Symbiobacteriaceae bacterium]|nr:hypothetical protein [Symbiobacteriaceae bacterium]